MRHQSAILPRSRRIGAPHRQMDKTFPLLLLLLCVLNCGVVCAQAIAVDYNQLVANVNRFKQNIDDVQSLVMDIWKGVIGGASAFWIGYAFWMLLGMFYYSFAYTYRAAKDEAKKEHGVDGRALADSLTAAVFNSLGAVPSKYQKALNDPCTRLVGCRVKNWIAAGKMAKFIPKVIRQVLGLNGPLPDCAALHPTCSWQLFLVRMIQ